MRIVELCVLYTLAAGLLTGETLVLDPAHSTIEFTLGDVLHSVHGTFKMRSSTLLLDPASGKTSGSIIVNAASGDSGSGARDRKMNKNILESDRYPEISFTPDSVSGVTTASGPTQVQVHGTFRIHGTDHEMTLPFLVSLEAGQVTAKTHFAIPYVKWGLKNPSTFLLKVDETVEIDIHATGRFTAR